MFYDRPSRRLATSVSRRVDTLKYRLHFVQVRIAVSSPRETVHVISDVFVVLGRIATVSNQP